MNSSVDRRSFLMTVAAVAAAPAALGQAPGAKPKEEKKDSPAAPPAADGPFTLPPLPYAPEALEAAIDAETMHLHHDFHHKAYVTNLNAAVKGLSVPSDVDVLVTQLESIPTEKRTAVRNNGGGHSNHSAFWKMLAPKGQGGEPSKDLVKAIETYITGVDKLKEAMNAAGGQRFGSGWAWLIVTKGDKKLTITTTANQDSPLMGDQMMDRTSLAGTPLLGLDVWEHAYYLRYKNRRPEYLRAIWDVVNWNEVSRRYEAAMREECTSRHASATVF